MNRARKMCALVTAAGAVVLLGASTADARMAAPKIQVLSTRADLVSGGDAYVRVTLPRGVKASRLRLTAGGRDVTGALERTSGRRADGVVAGLPVGRVAFTARIRGGNAARIFVTNHPIGGPVFAGPQIQPWACPQGAKDAQCDQPPAYQFMYLPKGAPTDGAALPGTTSNGGGPGPFQTYDPKNPPPADQVATTTTTDGVTVPFIVRLETGYIDRDQYAIATLFDPSKPWTATAPQRQFNHRMVITHGFSCDTEYKTGSAPSVLEPKLLGGGFVVMSNALDHAGHNCNLLTQAESLVMTKEYTIDHYGTLRWTIGSGCSGGSLAQQQVANAYPGVYQGITPQCSFTDAWSSAMQYEEYYFGLQYLENPSRWDPGVIYDPAAISAFFDHPNIANPVTFTSVIPNSGNPSRSCPGVPADQVYNAQTNPHGVRCTLQDYMVNAFGRDARGFARRGFDDVGIQYGLKGLRQHLISAAQFVDFNTHIGGGDIDLNITAARTAADPIALDRLYRTGAIDSANNLDKVAIIDLRGPDPGAFHDVYRTYAMRARLLRNFGTAANQILWRGQAPLVGDPSFADDSVFAMDRWLARVAADHRKIRLARKIIQDKPDTIAARCTDGQGHELPSETCDQTVASYGTPRQGADGPLAEDVMKCQLKPMRRDDYPVTFTDDQWKRLQQAFPGGVCNYGKPGVSQHGAVAWLTYQDKRGRVIYGGKPMGAPPASHRISTRH
ncbi:MAG: hypothetical protein QOC77_2562 [Thermoleophilaceae bacterium]|jgi:hypothetical protein|nr:hypothetical protein [Thermoleophilaceae bacterium]